ncbi:MAG: MBL fold metallo-hydrolase [Bacteroidales bacterium]|jgi:glyoxylase-like metal-dependent hydrolase (beta-lactamase superfamily II)|nr:MBL fold metallo-hydrolase [Bacteroidales bacterium]
MKIFKINTPEFKIDGGAYFGVIPKMIWEKHYPADKNNMCDASCRSLLIDDGKRIFLIDTGIGNKFCDNLKKDYFINNKEDLEKNIYALGYKPEEITDVILTHLHFDHCGGTTKISNTTGNLELTFPNAIHHISSSQWDNALNPNYREKSSYLKENFELLSDSGKLKLTDKNTYISENIELRIFNGHTSGLMLPVIHTESRTLFFAGDLIPAKASIPLAWISAYDVFPLTSIEEKNKLLQEAVINNWVLLFQHDYYNECCTLQKTDRGIRVQETFSFEEFAL